ncbi:MAG: VOC family protein [Bacteroidota bacterium]
MRFLNAFCSISTNLLEASYLFYKEKLGLHVDKVEDKFLHIYLSADCFFVMFLKEDHRASNATALNFQVDHILKTVSNLSEKGVRFLQYGPPFQTDKLGISWDDEGSHLAWFKDPGGNIIALIEN